MNNTDDILKRILLNMKYDPKKSLNENRKLVIKESCVPLDAKLTQFQEGSNRSNEYPELGKWKDGTCKCTSNTNCLEFKAECCKSTKVSVDDTKGIKYDVATDGSTLELPSDAKVLRRWDTSKVVNLTPQEFAQVAPRTMENCKSLYPNNIDKCLNDYKQKFINSVKNNSVSSFVAYDKTYKNCYTFNHVNKETGLLAPSSPEKITFFSGYFTDCEKRENPWNGVTKKETPKSSEDTSTGNKFAIGQKGAIKNEYDNETKFSFDLEL
jgi:hypothetical protein